MPRGSDMVGSHADFAVVSTDCVGEFKTSVLLIDRDPCSSDSGESALAGLENEACPRDSVENPPARIENRNVYTSNSGEKARIVSTTEGLSDKAVFQGTVVAGQVVETVLVFDKEEGKGDYMLLHTEDGKIEAEDRLRRNLSAGSSDIAIEGRVSFLGNIADGDIKDLFAVRRDDPLGGISEILALDTYKGPLGLRRSNVGAPDDVSVKVSGREDSDNGLTSDNDDSFEDDLYPLGLSMSTICCTKDGKRAFTGFRDGTFQIWDAETGEPLCGTQEGHEASITGAAWSADGTRIASGSKDKTVRMWDGKTGEAVGDGFHGHTHCVSCVAMSADGMRLASGSRDSTIRLWDTETGECVCNPLRGHNDDVLCVAFSKDGKRVVSGSLDKTVRIWDFDTGEAIGDALIGHSESVLCVAFSPNGKLISSGSHDGTARIWNVGTGDSVGNSVFQHGDWVTSVAWSTDGRQMVSGEHDKAVRVWEVGNSGTNSESELQPEDNINCLSWSADGKLVASGLRDGKVMFWDADTRDVSGKVLRGHSDRVECIVWSRDGKLVASGSLDKTARVWDVEEGICLALLSGWKEGDYFSLYAMLGEDLVSAIQGDEAKVVRKSGHIIFDRHGNISILATLECYATLAYSPVSRRVAAGLRDGRVHFFDVIE